MATFGKFYAGAIKNLILLAQYLVSDFSCFAYTSLFRLIMLCDIRIRSQLKRIVTRIQFNLIV